MHKSLQKNIFLVLLSFAFVFSACDKKDDDDATPNVGQDAACRMTQLVGDNSTPDVIEYNARGYVTKITSSGNDYILLHYDNNNRLTKMEEFDNGQLDSYSTYTYAGNNISKVNWFDDDNSSEGTETLKYDAQNRVVEILESYGSYAYKTVFTYNNQGNVEKREDSEDGVLYNRTVYANYDDKQRPWSALKGYPFYYDGSSKNNPGSETSVSVYEGQERPEDVTTYTYTYNDKGFPTKIVENYNGQAYTINFTYQCN